MFLRKAQKVFAVEAQAIKDLAKRLDKNFEQAVDSIAACTGRVVVTGMGKTGIVGRKIAATLSSTGTPSIWMHSAEAVHGDLGQVARKDIAIILSTSGETEETTRLLPLLKKMGVKTIALTGNMKSSLAKYSDIVLDVGVKEEGCPLGLAPMASTTATLVMGDALAACLILKKGFRKEDFAFLHPGGSLGRRLYLKVEDIMRKDDAFPRLSPEKTVKDVLLAVTNKRCGSACIIDKKGMLLGIFTDGDLRRHMEEGEGLLAQKVKGVMTKNPSTIRHDRLAVEAFLLLKDKKIDELPVVDKSGRAVGLLDVQDLMKAGLF